MRNKKEEERGENFPVTMPERLFVFFFSRRKKNLCGYVCANRGRKQTTVVFTIAFKVKSVEIADLLVDKLAHPLFYLFFLPAKRN